MLHLVLPSPPSEKPGVHLSLSQIVSTITMCFYPYSNPERLVLPTSERVIHTFFTHEAVLTEYNHVLADRVLGHRSRAKSSNPLLCGGPLRAHSHGALCVTGTNINDGLMTGISMLNKAREEHTVPERSTSTVIMLTDGEPNVGEAGGRGSKSESQYLAAIPGSVACLLQDLGQLSPGLLRTVSPQGPGSCLPWSGLPTLWPDKVSWP